MADDNFGNALRYIGKLYDIDGARKADGEPKPKDDVEKDFNSLVKLFRPTEEESLQNDFNMPPTLSTSPYFESRGFERSTLAHFGVADCSDKQHIMRHRSIIPVRYDNKQVGFIARTTQEWLQPKYLFSSGFKKTRFFYNYDEAIKHAQRSRCLFLVEGQGDVWKMWEAGVRNVMGLFGKSISVHQRRILLQSGMTTLIILTDNDQAGREAKTKIKREFSRFFNLIFPEMHTKDLGSNSTEKLQTNILSGLKGYYGDFE